MSEREFRYAGEDQEYLGANKFMVSSYRIDKQTAMKSLIEQEKLKAKQSKIVDKDKLQKK